MVFCHFGLSVAKRKIQESQTITMRILVLNYEFPPIGGGGGRFCEDLCRHLAGLGHNLRVQTVHFRGLPMIETRPGYAIYRSKSGRRRAHTGSVAEMASFLLMSLIPAWRHVATWKPDVIHVHFAVPTGVLGWLLHRATGVPYVVSVQLGDVPGGLPDQTEHLFRWIKPFTVPIWRDAAAITAPSEHIRQLGWRSYRVPIEVVPNGVDTARIKPSPPTPHKPVRLVFAGRFNPQKNLMFLMDLLRASADLDWEMNLVGDGPLMELLKTTAHRGGLAQRVHFHGWVSPDQVESIFSRSDILVMPSLSEGLPVAGVRALAAGLAILGSDIDGITELVQQGVNGHLCPVGDAEAFATALRTMLSGEDQLARMKAQSRKWAEKFDLQAVARKMEKILAQAAA
jgi:glycosyltransferase involved in cell wall biosynthesis